MAGAPHKVSLQFVLSWVRKNLRKKGMVGLADFAITFLSDYWFDYRYGTSTGGWIPSNKLQSNSDNVQHAVRYQPTKSRAFEKLMKQIPFPAESVFVDIGCGKGKALLMASRYRFKKALGVEFAHDLCEIARKNVAIFQEKTRINLDIEVVESDIIEYRMIGQENVFYLYNPFDDVILRRLLDNLEVSLRSKPRKIWVIYHIPKHAAIIEERDVFTTRQEYVVGGTDFIVYTNG